MPKVVENVGSAARDFCMLERNFLSHAKLALLLLVLTASVLLRVRLPGVTTEDDEENPTKYTIPLASVEAAAAVIVLIAGLGEYEMGFRDMRMMNGDMASTK